MITRITTLPRNSGQYTGHWRAIKVSRILKPKAPARGPKNDWTPPRSATTKRLEGLVQEREVGKYAAVEEREEPARQPREGAGQDEGDELMAPHVHADEASAPRVVPDGLEGVAKGRVHDGMNGDDGRPHDGQREVAVRARRLQPGRGPDVENAIITAGEGRPLEDHREDDLGEGQRQHGEVRVGQPDDEEAEDQRASGRHHGSGGEPQQHGQLAALDEEGGRVGAKGEVGGVPE